MDAAKGVNDPQSVRNFDPQTRPGAAEPLKTVRVVFDEAFQAGVDCFGPLLEQCGLSRDNFRLLRSFADVISAAVLRRCSEDGGKSCFVVSLATSKRRTSSLSVNNPDSTKSKKADKRKEPLEKKTSIRAAKAQRYLAWRQMQEDPSDAAREDLRRCAALVRERKRIHTATLTRVPPADVPPVGSAPSSVGFSSPCTSDSVLVVASAPMPPTSVDFWRSVEVMGARKQPSPMAVAPAGA